jgi:tetratricopeptide (TPR) repeat protein
MEKAIGAYRQAAALDSTDMQTWYRLGIVYKDDGQYEQAVRAYQRVMQSKSKFATDSRYRLAMVFNAMHCHQEAIDALGQYLWRDPHAASALMVLGEAHENLGQHAQAIEAYTKASADSRWKQFANYKIEELKKYVEEE